MTRDTISHQHGDNGVQPQDGLNFTKGGRPDPEEFDWWWTTAIDRINGHADEFTRLDSDDDGVVDKADYANDADASTFKGNDLDSDGDGVVDEADKLDGYEGQELYESGGQITLPSMDLQSGNFVSLIRYPSLPTNTTLDINRAVISNGSFNSPTGLNLIVYDATNNTVLSSYNGYNEVSDSIDVSGLDILIAADNGHHTTGTGSNQSNVTAELSVSLN